MGKFYHTELQEKVNLPEGKEGGGEVGAVHDDNNNHNDGMVTQTSRFTRLSGGCGQKNNSHFYRNSERNTESKKMHGKQHFARFGLTSVWQRSPKFKFLSSQGIPIWKQHGK